jgi:hypothetical protein
MTTLLNDALHARKAELEEHIALAKALDLTLFEGDTVAIGDTILSASHLLNIKSGLIVHLYNIVEAIMTRTMEEVGRAVLNTDPVDWSNQALREWLRFSASINIEGTEDTRLEVVHHAALKLLAKETINELKFKKPSGTWSDKVIYAFSQRLNVHFPLNRDIARIISPLQKYGDQSPLVFLAERRNAIAHGRRSFEEGANDLTLNDIQELATLTIEYLEFAVDAFQQYIENEEYKTSVVT